MSRLEQGTERRRVRWWTAAGAGLVVVAAMLSVTYYASAADEGPDALAAAAHIPNDQGPPPECLGTPPRRDRDRGRASARPTPPSTVDPNADPSTVDSSTSAPPSGRRTSAAPSPTPSLPRAPRPDRCHTDMGGPMNSDFIDIRQVQPSGGGVRNGRNASTGTFVSVCGTNKEGHHNSDNFIVAPGVTNGAHHVHDYVGNVTTDGNSTNESLAAGGTTCRFGDRSAYYWPVLRRTNRGAGPDANTAGGGLDGNVGTILEPVAVQLQFAGNSQSRVRALPRFTRVITGDAKSLTNGPANARAKWTCSGFGNRTTQQYPVCPSGSQIQRVLEFPSCWDGQNTDSANHRSHIVFPGTDGRCPQRTFAVPRLTMTISYDRQAAGAFALDSFPEQLHAPITDHGDFTNVMSAQLMNFVVGCLNTGRRC